MPLPVDHWVWLSVAAFIAAILRGALGMGFALMVIPFFVFLEPDLVPGTIIGLGLLLSILVMTRDWKSIDFTGLKLSIPGRFLGNIIAVLLFASLATEWFDLAVGSMVLVAVLLSLLPVHFSPTRRRLFVAGLFSGIMGTVSSLDGPPMALLYQHQKGDVIRATLGGYFVLGGIASLIALAFADKLGMRQFLAVLWLTPASLLGFWCSRYAVKFLPREAMRVGILTVSAISAVGLLLRAVLSS